MSGNPDRLLHARPSTSAATQAGAPDEIDAAEADRRLAGASAEEIVRWAVDTFGEHLIVSTSFGIQAAATLHLVTRVKPDVPVVWVDTGYLPPETYVFAKELTERLGLNLHVYQSPISPARMEALYGRLWESDNVEDLNRYDRIRKVEPMQRALAELGARAWISGIRADQTEHRSRLPRIGMQGKVYKISPILRWTSKDVHEYLTRHDLPYHPLFEKGYVTVGDSHSSRPLTAEDAHERDTRFGGKKQECGLHLTPDEAKSLDSSGL